MQKVQKGGMVSKLYGLQIVARTHTRTHTHAHARAHAHAHVHAYTHTHTHMHAHAHAQHTYAATSCRASSSPSTSLSWTRMNLTWWNRRQRRRLKRCVCASVWLRARRVFMDGWWVCPSPAQPLTAAGVSAPGCASQWQCSMLQHLATCCAELKVGSTGLGSSVSLLPAGDRARGGGVRRDRGLPARAPLPGHSGGCAAEAVRCVVGALACWQNGLGVSSMGACTVHDARTQGTQTCGGVPPSCGYLHRRVVSIE